jgi:FkbM family methyltransferase
VGLKTALLRFLARRNYAVVHADALQSEREAAARAVLRVRDLETPAIPPVTRVVRSPANGREPAAVSPSPAPAVPPLATLPETNDLKAYANVFDGITPWSGVVPDGFEVDFLGTLISKKFFQPWGYETRGVASARVQTQYPRLAEGENGEHWFEAVDWVQAAREARGRFVMVTLGALHGYQAVASQRTLQRVNPLPYTLVAVEPDPENMEWVRTHVRDNGIDPERQWLLQAAIGATNEPVFFAVGAPGSGAANCLASDGEDARKSYLAETIAQGKAEEVLTNLVLHKTTGLRKDLIAGKNFTGEIKLVSTVTLADVLAPFDRVDLLESDIQQSEISVFPPFRDLVKRKVHRVHIGTHGKGVHRALLQMFHDDGWHIVFSYEPESKYETVFGTVTMNDGVLSLLNPDV